MRKPSFSSAEEFLAERNLFALGQLPTEGFHPSTSQLHRLCQDDPSEALEIIRSIDLAALDHLIAHVALLEPMGEAIANCLKRGHRIFLSGCGATGRLSLALESVWRHACEANNPSLAHRVQGLMAGGDIALVRSVENFEDIPEFGARHLASLGFERGDLLLAITEGGETPFVIGTVEYAAHLSKEGGAQPFFLHCNPPDLLCRQVERSRKVYENPLIHKIAFPIGPMALSGSTRLQATTVLMMAVGECLIPMSKGGPRPGGTEIVNSLRSFRDHYQSVSLAKLADFSLWEAQAIKEGNRVLYETEEFGISILTDTTERSPTFSLQPFENELDGKDVPPSWAYLSLPSTTSSEAAWKKILGRLPLGLDWEEYRARLSGEIALAFNFSQKARERRAQAVAPKASLPFSWKREEKSFLSLSTEKLRWRLPLPPRDNPLHDQMLVKLLLNSHSLVFMGMLGRYEKNVMTWVRPSNGKLIDRAIRYTRLLLSARGKETSYEEVAIALFSLLPNMKPNEPIVLHLLKRWGFEPGGHSWNNR